MNSRKAKRESVLKKNKRNRLAIAIVAAAVIVAVPVVILSLRRTPGRNTPASTFSGQLAGARPGGTLGAATTVSGSGGVVALEAGDFEGGEAKYYQYRASGTTVRFFVLKSSDGVIRAAFDACDVCYRSKRGYRQEGDLMICNNCGQAFPSRLINVEKGGCNPSPLERTVADGTVAIRVADIAAGASLF